MSEVIEILREVTEIIEVETTSLVVENVRPITRLLEVEIQPLLIEVLRPATKIIEVLSGGPPGPTGPAGIQGDQGATGAQGDQGIQGDQGATGAQGDQGIQGLEGMVWLGTWSPATVYGVDDAVFNPTDGSGYICILGVGPTGTPPNSDPTHWELFASKGDTGATGAQGEQGNLIFSGVGAPSEGLGLGGDFYLRTDTSQLIGSKPTDLTWVGAPVLELKGDTGDTGAAGATGPSGNAVLNGTGDPGGGDGTEGDFWINTTTDQIFGPKTGGAWGLGTPLVGPAGVPGDPGAAGPMGETSALTTYRYEATPFVPVVNGDFGAFLGNGFATTDMALTATLKLSDEGSFGDNVKNILDVMFAPNVPSNNLGHIMLIERSSTPRSGSIYEVSAYATDADELTLTVSLATLLGGASAWQDESLYDLFVWVRGEMPIFSISSIIVPSDPQYTAEPWESVRFDPT